VPRVFPEGRLSEVPGSIALSVRGRLIARFAPNTRIRVRSLDDLRKMAEKSIDLAVMNSVAQYMTPDELDSALAVIQRRLVKLARYLELGGPSEERELERDWHSDTVCRGCHSVSGLSRRLCKQDDRSDL
jgi:hypothetical protein